MIVTNEDLELVYLWKPREVHAHYMSTTIIDGQTATDVIQTLKARKGQRASIFQLSALPDPYKKHISIEREIKDYTQRIEAVEKRVKEQIIEEAVAGKWLAAGLIAGEYEKIPKSYWPFLTLDFDNAVAFSDDIIFRDLRCALTIDLSASGSDDVEFPLQAPAHGTAGRPSNMKRVKAIFKSRQQAGSIAPSLTRESKALAAEFHKLYPTLSAPAPKTIANKLGEDYRAAVAALSSRPKK